MRACQVFHAPANPTPLRLRRLDEIESHARRLPRHLMLYLVGFMLACLLGWCYFGRLDIIASAEGRLVPQGFVKIVQPAEAGVVGEILVREGQRVAAGQVLMRMDAQLLSADRRALESEIRARSLQLRRIDAELAALPLQAMPGDDVALFAQIAAQYRAHRQHHLDALAQENQVLQKARHELAAATAILAKLQATSPMLRKQADAYANLERSGYVSAMLAQEKQREALERDQDGQAQQATVTGLEAAIEQSRLRTAQLESAYRSQLQNERVEHESQLARNREEHLKQRHRIAWLELKAPRAGLVKDLATHTAGTVVSPGTILLTLVPEGEPLVAEIRVMNDDIGFVQTGMDVKLKLVAYAFQKYGMLSGRVIHLAADAQEGSAAGSGGNNPANGEPGPGKTGYKALVELDTQHLASNGDSLPLLPGMQVIAEIRQGRRSVMEYLLSPVQAAYHDSGRER